VRLLEDPRIIQEELNRRLGGGQECRSAEAAARAVAADRARLAKGMDRLADCLSGRSGESGATALRMPELRKQDQALQAELQSLETVEGDQNQVSAAGRGACRFWRPAAGAGRHAGRARATEGLATAGERGPRGPGNDHHPPLDSDTGFRGRSEWGAATASRTSAATGGPARPMLPCAFRPSCLRCWPTSTWMRWTGNWSDGDIVSAGTPTTATST